MQSERRRMLIVLCAVVILGNIADANEFQGPLVTVDTNRIAQIALPAIQSNFAMFDQASARLHRLTYIYNEIKNNPQGIISVYKAKDDAEIYIVEMSYDGEVTKVWSTGPDSIKKKLAEYQEKVLRKANE